MQGIINLNNKREPDQKLATEAAMSLVQLAELRFNWGHRHRQKLMYYFIAKFFTQ